MARSDWEVVKDPKKKTNGSPAAGHVSPPVKVSPAKAIVTATNDNKSKTIKKSVKKGPPKKQPFELSPETVEQLTKSTSVFDAANILGAQLIAPESIPPYTHQDHPSIRLCKEVKASFDNLLSKVKSVEERKKLLHHVITNLISASRRAENAWGWRCVGQLLVRKFPELAKIKEDVLGTETHPGSVLSVIWVLFESSDPDALLSVLETLVYPRLNMKKVAEYLPKLTGKLKDALKERTTKTNSPMYSISAKNYSSLIKTLSDSKLSKNIQTELEQLSVRLRIYSRPDESWVEPLLSHMCTSRQVYALPMLLMAIEQRPAQSTQMLKGLSNTHRLQVQFVLDSVPESTLGVKYRKIIESSLSKPVKASPKPKSAEAATSSIDETMVAGKGSIAGYLLGRIPSYCLYFLIFSSLSSQFECTRPIYNKHFKDTYDTVVIPKYDEFVNPYVQEFVVPAYQRYGKPNVDKVHALYNAHLKKQVDSASSVIQAKLEDTVFPTIRQAQKDLEPFVYKAMKNGTILVQHIRKQVNVLAENWGVVVENGIADARVQIDNYAGIAREKSLLGLAQMQHQSKKYYALALANTEDFRKLATVKLAESYELVLVKTQDGILYLQGKAPIVTDFLIKHKVDKIFSMTFEGIGRSLIWTGDLIGELAEGRFCCAKDRMVILGNEMYDLGANAYNQAAKMLQNQN